MIGVLREVAGGAKVASVCRLHGITEQTYDRWKQTFGDLQVPEARRLKALEVENRRLKRLLADQALNIQVLEYVAEKDWSRPDSGGRPLRTCRPTPESASGGRVGGWACLGCRCGMSRTRAAKRARRCERGCASWRPSIRAGARQC